MVPNTPFSKTVFEINKEDKVLSFLVKDIIEKYFLRKFDDILAIAQLLFENINEQNIYWLIAHEVIELTKPAPSSVLEAMLNEDEEENKGLFAGQETSTSPYNPKKYLKIQDTINDKINQQGDSLLTTNNKKTLLQSVEILCDVISGGCEYV